MRWVDKPVTCLKYVEDCLAIEKIVFKSALRLNINGRQVSVSKATKSNAHFRTVSFNASARGMLLNSKKTKMLTISTAKNYVAESYIYDDQRICIDCDPTMKVLGFNFGKMPNINEHMRIAQKMFKMKLWT